MLARFAAPPSAASSTTRGRGYTPTAAASGAASRLCSRVQILSSRHASGGRPGEPRLDQHHLQRRKPLEHPSDDHARPARPGRSARARSSPRCSRRPARAGDRRPAVAERVHADRQARRGGGLVDLPVPPLARAAPLVRVSISTCTKRGRRRSLRISAAAAVGVLVRHDDRALEARLRRRHSSICHWLVARTQRRAEIGVLDDALARAERVQDAEHARCSASRCCACMNDSELPCCRPSGG